MLFQKEWPANVTMAQAEKSWCTQHAVDVGVNKQVKGKVIAKNVNIHIEHIKVC